MHIRAQRRVVLLQHAGFGLNLQSTRSVPGRWVPVCCCRLRNATQHVDREQKAEQSQHRVSDMTWPKHWDAVRQVAAQDLGTSCFGARSVGQIPCVRGAPRSITPSRQWGGTYSHFCSVAATDVPLCRLGWAVQAAGAKCKTPVRELRELGARMSRTRRLPVRCIYCDY